VVVTAASATAVAAPAGDATAVGGAAAAAPVVVVAVAAAAAPAETAVVAAVATTIVPQEVARKASAVENGKAEAWGAGVERKGVMTAVTVELRAEVLKEVESRRRYATRDIARMAKLYLLCLLLPFEDLSIHSSQTHRSQTYDP
jgi:hypothetical protein